MANKKITDATTATSVAGTDKVFLNQGGDLKQVDLNSAVANSQAVQTLNSNLGTIHCIRLVQEKGATQSYSFPAMEGDRRPFLYCHGSQNPGETTLICGVIHSIEGITTYDKICGKANVTIEGLTITSTLIGSWGSGYVIYFS